jgi:hypothetical protein
MYGGSWWGNLRGSAEENRNIWWILVGKPEGKCGGKQKCMEDPGGET